LERQVQLQSDDKEQLVRRNQEIREAYSVLEDKLKKTEQLVDHRLHLIDSQDQKMKEFFAMEQKLKAELRERERLYQELNNEKEAFRLESFDNRNSKELAEIEKNKESKQVQDLRKKIWELNKQVQELNNENDQLRPGQVEYQRVEKEKEGMKLELKQYQDTISYLSKELDVATLRA
jgi:chromosome segregation ATPase